MPEGTPLRTAFQNLVRETLSELKQSTGNLDPEAGTVISLNGDGTYNVQTGSSIYTSLGSPVILTLGQQVMVITAETVKTAVPR